jgi:hypothetical protein
MEWIGARNPEDFVVVLLLTYAIPLFVAFFGLLVLCIEFGRMIGRMRVKREVEKERPGTAAIEGAIFALLGLLVAFTFAGAAARFDARRDLIVAEANAIGTAYLRVDLVSPDLQAPLREAFRRYLASRVSTYENLSSVEAFEAAYAGSAEIQAEIWALAVAACSRPDAVPGLAPVLIPSINDMIDITTTRAMAMQKHPPAIIFLMLFGVSMICAVIAGYGMRNAASRNWIHILGFAAVMSATLYVIVDLEYPRLGFIQIGDFEKVLHGVIK